MNSIAKWNLQINESFRDEINRRIYLDSCLKAEIAEQMCISSSTLYKRLNGSSEFTTGELVYLMRKFNLSFDSMVFDPGQSINIQLPGMIHPVKSIDDYIKRLQNLLQQVNNLPDSTIYYTSHEVPFFYYCIDPLLGAFKLFMFANAVWGLKTFEDGAVFDPAHYSSALLKDIQDLWEGYSHLTTSEVWNPNIWDNTIQQILFMSEIKAFPCTEVALDILSRIDHILDKIERMVQVGHKYSAGLGAESRSPLTVFNNRMIYSNNVIIVDNDIRPYIFIIHDNPNFFVCEDDSLIKYTLNWIRTLEKKSYNLSHASGHHRINFFKLLHSKIDYTRKKVELLDKEEPHMF